MKFNLKKKLNILFFFDITFLLCLVVRPLQGEGFEFIVVICYSFYQFHYLLKKKKIFSIVRFGKKFSTERNLKKIIFVFFNIINIYKK